MAGETNHKNALAPSLCRDTMELLFRNALANESPGKGSGALIKRIAISNKMVRDSLVRVTRRFRTAVFTSGKVTLNRDQETTAVTIGQFSWLMRMDMLRFVTFEISCSSADECKTLSKVPHMPTLRELKCSGVDWVKLTQSRSPLAAYQLAAAIIKSNASTLKVLEGLPVPTFSEALPALELDTFVFTPASASSISLTALDKCSMDVFEYDVSRCFPRRIRISLEPLANLDATEIFWKFSDFDGFEEMTTSATNNHVEIVCLEAESFRSNTTDFDRLLSFFPNLRILAICLNYEVPEDSLLAYVGNESNPNGFKQHLAQTHGTRPLHINLHAVFHHTVMESVEWTGLKAQELVLKMRNHFSEELPETDGNEQIFNIYVTFHRVSESDVCAL
ncbi:hypothetical protein AAVH_22985 [Aphelenchoides avenae]|nr:hypothetical protein AAVH_22985 [Aphelenchus avenae]